MLRLLLALLCVSVVTHAQDRKKVIAVGFYNCENLFDTLDNPDKQDEDFTPRGAFGYTGEVYKQKLHNMASVMQQMGTDVTPDGPAIIGLVEIENNRVLTDLVAQPEIRGRNYRYCWFPTPDERGISTAMLFNPRYFTVLNASPRPVPVESIGWARPTRSILYVTGILAGDTVHVMVNHWPSKSGGEDATAPGRMLAAMTLRRIVDSITAVSPSARVLVMGDFNDNPTATSIVQGLRAKEERGFLVPGDIYNPFIRMYKKGLGTENYRGEWGLIDQVMMTTAVTENSGNYWRFHRAEIFNKEFLTHRLGNERGLPHRSFTAAQVWDNGYSDHFPVLIYLVK